MTDKTEPALERRMYAYCCAQAGGDPETCDCTNKSHDYALFEVKATLPPNGDEVERLRAALGWYGDQFCELGASHECCGRLTPDDCSGCFARQALKGTPA